VKLDFALQKSDLSEKIMMIEHMKEVDETTLYRDRNDE